LKVLSIGQRAVSASFSLISHVFEDGLLIQINSGAARAAILPKQRFGDGATLISPRFVAQRRKITNAVAQKLKEKRP
jgi:hypothetical protein